MTRLFGALLIARALFGQATSSPPAAPTDYTIASIKPNKSSDDRFMLRPMPGGGLTATGVTLKMLMGFAYGVFAYQISGGPAWIGTERWDIEAKTDSVQERLPRDQSNALLRALIEDRFQLKVRRESKEMQVYALVVTKNGSRLKPNPDDPTKAKPSAMLGNGTGTFTNSSMAVLTSRLSEQLGRPVIDRTDLKGGFDFTLEWTPASGEDGAESSDCLRGPGGWRLEWSIYFHRPARSARPEIGTAKGSS